MPMTLPMPAGLAPVLRLGGPEGDIYPKAERAVRDVLAQTFPPGSWTRQGTDGLLGHDRCQGQTCGWQARRQEAWSLMGGWGGASTADTPGKKTGRRLQTHVGGGVCQAAHNAKKVLKSGVQGTYCLLTQEPSNGCFSYPRQANTRTISSTATRLP